MVIDSTSSLKLDLARRGRAVLIPSTRTFGHLKHKALVTQIISYNEITAELGLVFPTRAFAGPCVSD